MKIKQSKIFILANETSDDMRSSLSLEWTNDLRLLKGALKICTHRGEKTKSAMLTRKIKKINGRSV